MTNTKSLAKDSLLRIPVAVDLVILTVVHDELHVLLIRRGIAPYKNRWALPGGFIRPNESLEQAAQRELEEETGIPSTRVGHIEQLATFGAPKRDPRERVISVAYVAIVPDLPEPIAGGDAHAAKITPVLPLLDDASVLAFDHHEILRAGVERARAKLEYTPLAAAFCKAHFTIHELRKIYEAVWGIKLDPANFHRKVTKTPGFVEPTEEMVRGESGRPAQAYRQGQTRTLYPPLLRTSQSNP